MAECIKCRSFQLCPWATPPEIICSQFKPTAQTHYDRIISKTPDELADFLVSTMTCTACQDMHGGKCPKPKDYKEKKCRDIILDWLKSPVEVDNG